VRPNLDPALLLARIQAAVLVLAVITLLTTVRCAVVRAPALPVGAGARTTGRQPSRRGRLACIGLVLAVVATVSAAALPGTQPVAVPAAALSGFAAGLCGALWLFRLPRIDPGPIVALASVLVAQLTVGWLPLVEPDLATSPVPLLMGLLLAGAAIRAASVEPFAALPAPVQLSLDLDAADVTCAGEPTVDLAAVVPSSASTGPSPAPSGSSPALDRRGHAVISLG
jgi:hypothetical protein